MSNILITGAAGYLARSIIERLRPHHALTLFDRVPPKRRRPWSAPDVGRRHLR